MKFELIYLRKREAQACELADGASDGTVKAIHFEMAATYAARIAVIETMPSTTARVAVLDWLRPLAQR